MKTDKQACHVRGCCIDSFNILSHTAGWNNNKHLFINSAFLLFRATNPMFGNNRKLEQFSIPFDTFFRKKKVKIEQFLKEQFEAEIAKR